MRCGRITEQHRPQMSLFERANVSMRKLCIGHNFMLRSVIPDLKCLKWYQVAFLFIFGVTVVTFNILDFNKITSKKSDTDDSTLLKYTNDEKAGIEYWRRILMCLSAAAAFTGAMSVVLTTLGKISSLFWGIINCVLYGLYAFAYGYAGDAQLNIVFFLPMQYYGIIQWMDEMERKNKAVDIIPQSVVNDDLEISMCEVDIGSERTNVGATVKSTLPNPPISPPVHGLEPDDNYVRVRSLTPLQILITLVCAFGISVAFYFEIPEFAKALTGFYVYDGLNTPRTLDAANNGISIMAQVLLVTRYWECWLLWQTSNAIQISMFTGLNGYGVDFNILVMLCLFVINAFCGLALWFKRSHPDSIQRVGLHFRKLAGGSDEGSDGGIEESKKTLLVDGLQSKDNSDINSNRASTRLRLDGYPQNSLTKNYRMTTNPAKSIQALFPSAHPSTSDLNNSRMGIVIGKFYPFHKGHELLIQTALTHVNQASITKGFTHVIICFQENEAPSGALRYEWIRERFPTVVLHRLLDNYGRDDDSQFWASITLQIVRNFHEHSKVHDDSVFLIPPVPTDDIVISKNYLSATKSSWQKACQLPVPKIPQPCILDTSSFCDFKLPPDTTVFTSEDYGLPYSQFLGCAHQLVDRNRIRVPTSGTAVRSNASEQWENISNPLRGYYAMRFVLVGAESTGKSTLTSILAQRYETTMVEEYGREYSEKQVQDCAVPVPVSTILESVFTEEQKSPNKEDLIPGCTDYDWCTEDFLHIAAVQNQKEIAQARLCNRILICDTDSFATSIWHERYMERVDRRVMQIFDELRAQSDFSKRHYFLMDSVGVQFVQDGYRDGEHLRAWFFERFEQELKKTGLDYSVLRGSYHDRERQACEIIDNMIRG